MSTAEKNTSINIRLTSELKSLIEDAAARLGQSVNEFAVATLLRESRQVFEDANVTELSPRDRDTILAALEDAEPNEKLKAAARHYEKQILGDG